MPWYAAGRQIARTAAPRVADVFIALGANTGDRSAHLRRGLALLEPELRVAAVSPLYESAPVGVTDQPDFLNAVLRAETALEPLALLDKLKAVETTVGRRPGPRWGPRPLDLDILAYDDLVMETERLTIPHPRIGERGFVLKPLLDLVPNLVLPGWSGTIEEALASANTQDLSRVAGPEWAEG